MVETWIFIQDKLKKGLLLAKGSNTVRQYSLDRLPYKQQFFFSIWPTYIFSLLSRLNDDNKTYKAYKETFPSLGKCLSYV
jgi:hypothetical protein